MAGERLIMAMSYMLAELLLESLQDPEVVFAVRVVDGVVLYVGLRLQLWWWWRLPGEPRCPMAPHF
jgi:hypothetical protein